MSDNTADLAVLFVFRNVRSVAGGCINCFVQPLNHKFITAAPLKYLKMEQLERAGHFKAYNKNHPATVVTGWFYDY